MILTERRAHHVFNSIAGGDREQTALAGSRADRRGSVHVIYGHLSHRECTAAVCRPTWFTPRVSAGGLLTPTSSRARIASSSVSAVFPTSSAPAGSSLSVGGHGRGSLAAGPQRRRVARAGRDSAGCRLSSDQRRPLTLLFTIFGYTPKELTKALALSERRGRRRHSRCVPRRRPQRVRQLAVALLHQPALAAVS